MKVRKDAKASRTVANGNELQWGRTREGAEGCLTVACKLFNPRALQWGRTREGAEGLDLVSEKAMQRAASVGPHP